MVAWHEVPGNVPNEIRPVGYGLIGVPIRHLGRGEWMENQTAMGHRSYVPYGTDSWSGRFPGTSCQATIMPSLRDSGWLLTLTIK